MQLWGSKALCDSAKKVDWCKFVEKVKTSSYLLRFCCPPCWSTCCQEYIIYLCYAQTVDRDNPWIALRKLRIHALRNNPWIVCANCGSMLCATQSQVPQIKGTGHNHREGLRHTAITERDCVTLRTASCTMDCLCKAWIHSLHRAIRGLSRIHALRITYIQE